MRRLGAPLVEALEGAMPGARARGEITAALAGAIAVEAGEPDAAVIAEAARLQEVGKLYVEPELRWLPLGAGEPGSSERLAAHFEHGHALARGAGLPNRVCAWILNARERWDGGGPTGLGGTEIPFGARAIAVAREYVDAPQAESRGEAVDPRAAGIARLGALAGTVLDAQLAASGARLAAAPAAAALTVSEAAADERPEVLALAAADDGGRRPVGELPLLLARDASGAMQGALAWEDRESVDRAEIAGIWVRERGAGTGSALLDAVAEEARLRRRRGLLAAVGNDELAAFAFLQHRGFRLRELRAAALAGSPAAEIAGAGAPIAPRDLLVLERDLTEP